VLGHQDLMVNQLLLPLVFLRVVAPKDDNDLPIDAREGSASVSLLLRLLLGRGLVPLQWRQR
jgi:hypothetical protein